VLAVAGEWNSGQAASAAQQKISTRLEVATGRRWGQSGARTFYWAEQPAAASQSASEQVRAPRDLATGFQRQTISPVIIRKVSDDESMAARSSRSQGDGQVGWDTGSSGSEKQRPAPLTDKLGLPQAT
jgi:hypothetical protein